MFLATSVILFIEERERLTTTCQHINKSYDFSQAFRRKKKLIRTRVKLANV